MATTYNPGPPSNIYIYSGAGWDIDPAGGTITNDPFTGEKITGEKMNVTDTTKLSEAAIKRREKGAPRWADLLGGDVLIHQDGRKIIILPQRKFTYESGAYAGASGEYLGGQTLVSSEGWSWLSGGPAQTGSTPKGKGKVSFDSVILPKEKKDAITDAIGQVDNHDLIFNKWGFGEVFEKGTAISLLFYGLPGTGKTLMAQAIADKYGYKLQVVSTAEVETPEPGGAERNIQKYFKEATKDTVLLFDECDSLISDRAHLGMIMAAQVNALLTALEQHTGIVIFTTNRLGALDPAFDRRLSLKLEFEMPTAEHRVQIWKRMFPKQAPLAKDIDWDTISQVEIAGGHIKNIVLRAARRAANTTKQITQDIIAEALIEETEANQDFSDALANHSPLYGAPVAGRQVQVVRKQGKIEVNRG